MPTGFKQFLEEAKNQRYEMGKLIVKHEFEILSRGTKYEYSKLLSLYDQMLERLEAMEEDWVSVDNRKPDINWEEEDCDVLVYGCKFGDLKRDTAGHCLIAYWNGKFWEDDLKKDIESNPDFWTITHWKKIIPPQTK